MATELFAGGLPDASRPENLADAGLADVLEVATQAYVPIGQEASRWIGKSEFSEFAEKYAQNDNCFGFGDEKSLSAENAIWLRHSSHSPCDRSAASPVGQRSPRHASTTFLW